MNNDEDLAHLEWWANPSTCLARIPIRIEVIAGDAWNAAVSPELDDQTRDGLEFLIDLSPVFTLRFDNDSVVEVAAGHSGDLNHLHLQATPDMDAQGP
ncbi:hypothetical protein [Streptomyces sp. NPDC020742]|uniref:hypothetical protein n=1 Tax=unclassified Streptomyces TaxID=2593676 RepID=UPI0034053E8C